MHKFHALRTCFPFRPFRSAPLLRWREGKLERIESNGLLFGVTPEPDYPVCDMPINPGDRFLLYTDGLIEPENSRGDPFGGRKLEQVVHLIIR